MATISITIAPEHEARVVAAFSSQFNYSATIPNPTPQGTVDDGEGNQIPDPAWTPTVSNPEAENDFGLRMVKEWCVERVQDVVKAAEKSEPDVSGIVA